MYKIIEIEIKDDKEIKKIEREEEIKDIRGEIKIIIEDKRILERICEINFERYSEIYYKMKEEDEKEEINKIIIENFNNSYTYYDEKKKIIKIKIIRCLFYTVNIGDNKPNDRPIIFNKIKNWDYKLFTNLESNNFNTSWEIIKISKKINNKFMMVKHVKWNIREYINDEYDIICYMDCNRIPDIKKKELYKNLVNILETKDLIMTKHESNRCIYKEAKNVVKYKKDTVENVAKNTNFLRSVKYPKYNGLYANGYYLRNMRDKRYDLLMEELINFMMNKSYRDQLAVNYIWWKNKITDIEIINYNDVPVEIIGKFKHVYL